MRDIKVTIVPRDIKVAIVRGLVELRGLTPKDAIRRGLSEREEDNERPSIIYQHLSIALLSSSELYL